MTEEQRELCGAVHDIGHASGEKCEMDAGHSGNHYHPPSGWVWKNMTTPPKRTDSMRMPTASDPISYWMDYQNAVSKDTFEEAWSLARRKTR